MLKTAFTIAALVKLGLAAVLSGRELGVQTPCTVDTASGVGTTCVYQSVTDGVITSIDIATISTSPESSTTTTTTTKTKSTTPKTSSTATTRCKSIPLSYGGSSDLPFLALPLMHLPISLLVFTVVTVLAGAISSTPAGTQATPRAVRSGAERTTNAQRLAMNLPPLKPKRLTAILKARTGIVIPYLLPRKHLYDKFKCERLLKFLSFWELNSKPDM
ncbi:hypothetical protein FRC05_001775 [Tulasnella sp. 425]|nr:hypothetical protein FRC05_001775 [Tulasnella sp. 425]